MKIKNKNNVMLLIALSFFALTTVQPVNAQNGEQIENIVEQIQEHNEREEDIREELKNLSLNELESVDEYLSSKPDITMDENQILTLTQDLLAEGSSVNYVAQENLNTVDEENIPTQLLLGVGIVMFLTSSFGLIAVSLSNRLT